MKNKIIYLMSFIIVFSSFILSAEVKKIIVTNSFANIRTLPGMEGKIIKTAKNGDIFIVLDKKGKWYKVSLTENNKNKSDFGYIHSSIVKLVSKGTGYKTSSKKKKSKREKLKKRKTGKNFSQDKLFSGFYIKGGMMTSPSVESFGDKWIVSFGFDQAMGKYMTWGLEIQPYFRSFSEDTYGISINDIATNIYLNAKGGANLGILFNSLKFITLYAGGGLGTALNYSSIKAGDIKGTQFDLNLSWHLMFGTEIKLGKTKLIIELQSNKIILKDVEPATQTYTYLFLGIRF